METGSPETEWTTTRTGVDCKKISTFRPFSSRNSDLQEVRVPCVHMKDGVFCRRTQELFSSFHGEKSFLVESIGFGGLLKLPTLQPVDASFSLWLLENFDASTMSVSFPGGNTNVVVRDIDVHLVLGIPYKGGAIKSRNNVADYNRIVRTHLRLPSGDDPVTIDDVEGILRRNYVQSMTEEDQVAFKVAVVLFASTFLVGSWDAKKELIIDVTKHLTLPTKINNVNWCSFVLKSLREEALFVQKQLRSGSREVVFSYCLHFLVVFYLDNIESGSLYFRYQKTPRICKFSPSFIRNVAARDVTYWKDGYCKVFGALEVRPSHIVCYTRGWSKFQTRLGPVVDDGNVYDFTDEMDYHFSETSNALAEQNSKGAIVEENKHNVSTIGNDCKSMGAPGEQNQPLLSVDRVVRRAAGDIVASVVRKFNAKRGYKDTNKTSTPDEMEYLPTNAPTGCHSHCPSPMEIDCIGQIKRIVGVPQLEYPYYFSTPSFMEKNHESQSNVGETSNAAPLPEGNGMAIGQIMPTFVRFDNNSPGGVSFYRKDARENSGFCHSPFDLGLIHCKATQKTSRALFRQLARIDQEDIISPWFVHNVPNKIEITAGAIRNDFSVGSNLSIKTADAVVRLLSDLDAQMYGGSSTRWRHFLPPSWAISVLYPDSEYDFLTSEVVRQYFVGDHLGYDVENCRMIIVPLYNSNGWSCYCWDFLMKTVTVLDPRTMSGQSDTVIENHQKEANILHHGMLSCIDTFFYGWYVDDRWEFRYPCGLSKHCKRTNSSIYSLEYARGFDGFCISSDFENVKPHDIRAGFLYQLLSMDGNCGTFQSMLVG